MNINKDMDTHMDMDTHRDRDRDRDRDIITPLLSHRPANFEISIRS
jgi:hypothetical protein